MATGLSSVRALVIGDVIVDRYIIGSADRISPEAPVPVLRQISRKSTPGGAANVASNIVALGGQATVIGVVGNDEAGSELEELLAHQRVNSLFTKATDRPTISKTRLMANHHQMIRLDDEHTVTVGTDIADSLFDTVSREITQADIVILSDYAKGTLSDDLCSRIIQLASRHGLATLVDPKRKNWSAFSGATIITPNRSELTMFTGMPCDTDEEAEAAAAIAYLETGAGILLTRSERGMSFFKGEEKPTHIPTAAREVFDVSGAGDTVMAALALGLGSSLPIEQVMRIANLAAAIAVGKVGTAVVTEKELADAIAEEMHRDEKAIASHISHSQALKLRESWRERGLNVGIANGCFDIIHPGHVTLIRKAAARCDRLILALNSDASVKRLKGPERPIQTEIARAHVMSMIKGVDAVVLFDEDTPENLICSLSPDILFKGSDYQVHQIAGASHVLTNGGRVELIELVPGHSTTSIVEQACRIN